MFSFIKFRAILLVDLKHYLSPNLERLPLKYIIYVNHRQSAYLSTFRQRLVYTNPKKKKLIHTIKTDI